MSADQQFWLTLVNAVFPIISTLALALIAFFTARMTRETEKLRVEQKEQATENRANLGELAKSINGVKSEIVAATRNAAMQEAALLESKRGQSPEADQAATDRLKQVSDEATAASKAATDIAHSVEKKILEVPDSGDGKAAPVEVTIVNPAPVAVKVHP